MKNIIDTYRGFNILQKTEKVNCSIIDHDRNVLNKNTPYFSTWVESKKAYVNGSCYTTLGGNLNYLKKEIDKGISRRKEIAENRKGIRNTSMFKTYICNNVTIRVLRYGDKLDIYVNEYPLRNPHLQKDFTFDDVLSQVYINTIAKYNITKWSSEYNKIGRYKNVTVETIDLSILPVYELLGMVFKYGGQIVEPYNVQRYGKGFNFTDGKKETFVPLEGIKDIGIISMENSSVIMALTALRHKAYFYE